LPSTVVAGYYRKGEQMDMRKKGRKKEKKNSFSHFRESTVMGEGGGEKGT